jgi:hypothetical protein
VKEEEEEKRRNEKYKGNGISIHPWGVIVERFTKQKKL